MLLRIIRVALRNLVRKPLRAFLVLQGIIWGMALGVVPAAVIQGTRGSIEERARELGTDRMLITQDRVSRLEPITWELVEQLRARDDLPIDAVTGLTVLDLRLLLDDCYAFGTDAHALDARNMQLAAGRWFTPEEIDAGAAVAVLEAAAAESLFPDADPLGNTVPWGDGRDLRVVGVTRPRPATITSLDELGYQTDHALRGLLENMQQYMGYYRDETADALRSDNAILVPYTFLDRPPDWIQIRAEPEVMLDLRERLKTELVARGIEPMIYINAALPVIYGPSIEMVEELDRVVFTLCILVGTAVVSTIMILSVLERRREIAIRRVEGARRSHVAGQFVIETTVLNVLGGLLGVPAGIGLAAVRIALEPHGATTWIVPWGHVWVLLAVVAGVGLLGGLLPAWQAMRVDPVEALRHE